MFEPFQDQFEIIFHKSFNQEFHPLYDQIKQKMFLGTNLNFSEGFFNLWNWVFRNNMKNNDGLMLQFEDFAVIIIFTNSSLWAELV